MTQPPRPRRARPARFLGAALTLGLAACHAPHSPQLSAPQPPTLDEDMPSPIDASLFAVSGSQVRSFFVEETIQAAAPEVFAAWTDGQAFRRAYDASRDELVAHIDLAIGGRYEWLFDGETGSNGCQILTYIPDRLVSFSWNAPPTQPQSRGKRTWVVVELTPVEGDGGPATRVGLTHLGFGPEDHWTETREYFAKAWPYVLSQFKANLDR